MARFSGGRICAMCFVLCWVRSLYFKVLSILPVYYFAIKLLGVLCSISDDNNLILCVEWLFFSIYRKCSVVHLLIESCIWENSSSIQIGEASGARSNEQTFECQHTQGNENSPIMKLFPHIASN